MRLIAHRAHCWVFKGLMPQTVEPVKPCRWQWQRQQIRCNLHIAMFNSFVYIIFFSSVDGYATCIVPQNERHGKNNAVLTVENSSKSLCTTRHAGKMGINQMRLRAAGPVNSCIVDTLSRARATVWYIIINVIAFQPPKMRTNTHTQSTYAKKPTPVRRGIVFFGV